MCYFVGKIAAARAAAGADGGDDDGDDDALADAALRAQRLLICEHARLLVPCLLYTSPSPRD